MSNDDGQFDPDRFFEGYKNYLSRVDELVPVILNAHLDIERHLDIFLDFVFSQSKHLFSARLSFFQKSHVARAYAGIYDENIEWVLIGLVNKLRNETAHGERTRSRDEIIGQLRQTLSGMGGEDFRSKIPTASTSEVIFYAAALATGFLAVIEEELWKVRNPGQTWQEPTDR